MFLMTWLNDRLNFGKKTIFFALFAIVIWFVAYLPEFFIGNRFPVIVFPFFTAKTSPPNFLHIRPFFLEEIQWTIGQVPAIVGQLRPSNRRTVFVKILPFVTDIYTFPFSDEPKIAIPL